MKKFRSSILLGIMVLAVSATGLTAFAAVNTKAETSTIDLEQWQSERLALKKDNLQKQVSTGSISQETADDILTTMEEYQENCTGFRNNRMGRGMGYGNGSGCGRNSSRGYYNNFSD